MKGWILIGLLVIYALTMIFVICLAALHVDHSKDHFCNTLPVQCADPAQR